MALELAVMTQAGKQAVAHGSEMGIQADPPTTLLLSLPPASLRTAGCDRPSSPSPSRLPPSTPTPSSLLPLPPPPSTRTCASFSCLQVSSRGRLYARHSPSGCPETHSAACLTVCRLPGTCLSSRQVSMLSPALHVKADLLLCGEGGRGCGWPARGARAGQG